MAQQKPTNRIYTFAIQEEAPLRIAWPFLGLPVASWVSGCNIMNDEK